MRHNLCLAPLCGVLHFWLPVRHNPCLVTHAVQLLFRHPCSVPRAVHRVSSCPCHATPVQPPLRRNTLSGAHTGATNVPRPCGATHVRAPVGRNPSLAAFAAQRVFCRPCDATHVQPPMRPKLCLAVESGSRHTSSQAWVGPHMRLKAEYAVWACKHELRGMDC